MNFKINYECVWISESKFNFERKLITFWLHRHFVSLWAKYKMGNLSCEKYGSQLLKAICAYTSRHLWVQLQNFPTSVIFFHRWSFTFFLIVQCTCNLVHHLIILKKSLLHCIMFVFDVSIDTAFEKIISNAIIVSVRLQIGPIATIQTY